MHTTEETQGLIDAHVQFKNTLGEAGREFNGIMSLVQELSRTAQPYGITHWSH